VVRRLAAVVVALAAAAVTACGGANPGGAASGGAATGGAATPTAAASTRPPSRSPAATAAPAVPRTLRFTATTVAGEPFDAATLAGRPVVFWFWAAWCPRCRGAGPDVGAVGQEFAGRVHVVGVAGLGSGAAQMRAFVTDAGVGGLVHLADDEGVVWRHFGVTEQEYYVMLDASGTVVHEGPLPSDRLRTRVDELAG
jgi:thiol-disulfide isomerase/thioredoxin